MLVSLFISWTFSSCQYGQQKTKQFDIAEQYFQNNGNLAATFHAKYDRNTDLNSSTVKIIIEKKTGRGIDWRC